MGKILIIAEKPSVARDIALALGGFAKADKWLESDTMVVTSALGHVVEIYAPEAEAGGRDLAGLPVIPPAFALREIEGRGDQYRLVAKLMKRSDVDTIVNACDAGREGELIFRLIYEMATCRKPMKRMWLQSMTSDAIRDAFRAMRPGSDYDGLASAARSRTESDWLVGINGSRGLTRLHELQTATIGAVNAGRVQTPTLAIVVDLENRLRNFVAKDYWEVHGTFKVASGTYVGKWFDPHAKANGSEDPPERLWDRARAQALVDKCAGQSPSEVTEETKPSLKSAPKLYDLTLLQREANKRFGLSAKKTLDIAQALYEKHKVTTYPRTSSNHLPEDYVPTAIRTLQDLGGTPYERFAKMAVDSGWVKPDKRTFNNAKITDHFAIIPTGKKPDGLTAEEGKVYDMIVRRFIATFYPSAEYSATTRITTVAEEKFRSTGRVLVSQGWLEVYGTTLDDDDEKTPALTLYVAGEQVDTQKVELKTLKTKPPVRFTEATLLSAMENAGKLVDEDDLRDAMKECGLGTPATRAAIIEGLLADQDGRGQYKEPYLTREGKQLVPTSKAMNLIAFLIANGVESLTSPKMTGEWEQKLLQMEQGGYDRARFMAEIEKLTRDLIEVIRRQAAGVKLPTAKAPCPKCSGVLNVGPRMLECQAACGFSLWRVVAGRPLSPAEADQLLTTGTAGPFDGFVAKSKKKFSASLSLSAEFKVEFQFDAPPTTDADGNDVHCHRCSSLMRRIKGSSGYFWSCSDRENCKTTLDDDNGFPAAPPKTKPCPACDRPMLLRNGGRGPFWGCTGYKEGHCQNIVPADPGEEAPPPRAGVKKAGKGFAAKSSGRTRSTSASKGRST